MRLFDLVKAGAKRPIPELLMGLSLWLAILAILVTIHSDVFEQAENRPWALIELPWLRLWHPEPPTIPLSSLMPEGSSDQVTTSPLYIFAIDVSASMAAQDVSERELERYREVVAPTHPSARVEGCQPHDEVSTTGFDIARLELCRYVGTIPLGSRAALWAFGEEATLMIPQPDEVGSRYIRIEELEQGGTNKNLFYGVAATLQPTEQLSDFESLLGTLVDQYWTEIDSEPEMHIIIISDFYHDIGGTQGLFVNETGLAISPERALWESRYRMSLAKVEDRLRALSRPGVTFHLSVVLGAHRMVSSVLPIVNGTLEWSAYRVLHMRTNHPLEDFDFLRAYEEVGTAAVPFFYAPGSLRPERVAIEVDQSRFSEGDLRVALATDASVAERFPARIAVTFDGEEPGLVRLGRRHVGRISHQGELIHLQPQSLLEPREASTYRLLFSWRYKEPQAAGVARSRTFAVPILFKKRLSLFGAISMMAATVFVVVFALWSLAAIVAALRQEAPP